MLLQLADQAQAEADRELALKYLEQLLQILKGDAQTSPA